MCMDSGPAFRAIRPSPERLEDEPIEPAWIIEGAPRARGAKLSTPSRDGLSVGTWDCTAGRFRWEYRTDEVIKVVEGHVRLTDVHGRTSELFPGDVATFEAGDIAYWEVPEYVRKVWVETNVESVAARVLLKLRMLYRRRSQQRGTAVGAT